MFELIASAPDLCAECIQFWFGFIFSVGQIFFFIRVFREYEKVFRLFFSLLQKYS